ncbi:MAG TPA: TIM barrel protein [Verrucomicrobiales bacterium]|jgi:sugar phosphate isomerase/epimerase|nr:TIM barrel protein [Verrucomicrobiales bacterium]
MLSFSTCWNSGRHTDGEAVVDEILSLGFDTIEISHGLKVSLLPGIRKAFADGRVKVSGVHNFCPSPVEVMIDAPDCYEFTSHRPYDRERALSLTIKTLEYAAEFASKYAVLHLGTVPMKKISKELTRMLGEGLQNTPAYVKRKIKLVKVRESLSRHYCGRARGALTKIAEAAEKAGVPVAVESRSSYEQVPTEREMTAIMQDFATPWVGYWHDFGHVQLKANVGLLDHYEWLSSIAHRLLGCHLHDVVWPARDHRVPFRGTVDYDRLLPLVPPEKPIIWELSPSQKKEDIIMALEIWRTKYPAWS